MSDRGSTPGMAANRGVLSYTGQAIGQLGDRKILLVLIKSTLLSGAALVALLMVLGFFWPDANLLEGWFDLFFGAEAAGGGENADTPPPQILMLQGRMRLAGGKAFWPVLAVSFIGRLSLRPFISCSQFC